MINIMEKEHKTTVDEYIKISFKSSYLTGEELNKNEKLRESIYNQFTEEEKHEARIRLIKSF